MKSVGKPTEMTLLGEIIKTCRQHLYIFHVCLLSKPSFFWKNLNFQYEYLHEIEAIWDIFLHVNQGSRREKSWGVKIS